MRRTTAQHSGIRVCERLWCASAKKTAHRLCCEHRASCGSCQCSRKQKASRETCRCGVSSDAREDTHSSDRMQTQCSGNAPLMPEDAGDGEVQSCTRSYSAQTRCGQAVTKCHL